MAEKQEKEDVPIPSQGLTCPLCLDIFDDATLLTCGHTFCRACLKKYDLSHQDLDHMVCPLCRTVTKFSANRVDDLLTNVTVNGLVDDYRARSGGASAIQEMRQKCTVCNLQVEPIAFCITCNISMCDQCRVGHKRLQMFFEGHEIVSIQDIIEGNVKRHPSDKCSVHRLENKDMFCQDCKMRVCFKCVVIDHRDHKIKSHMDFEKEMQAKVSDLLHRCKAKKSELEENIQTVETHRHEAHTALQLLREDVGQACRTKVKHLEDNRRVLVEKIDALERSFDGALNGLKSKDRKMIKSICSSIDLVANDRLGCLETDSLAAHTFLCEEIDGLLKEVIDQTSAATIREKARKQRFKPAADTSLDLGNISQMVLGQPPPRTINPQGSHLFNNLYLHQQPQLNQIRRTITPQGRNSSPILSSSISTPEGQPPSRTINPQCSHPVNNLSLAQSTTITSKSKANLPQGSQSVNNLSLNQQLQLNQSRRPITPLGPNSSPMFIRSPPELQPPSRTITPQGSHTVYDRFLEQQLQQLRLDQSRRIITPKGKILPQYYPLR